MRVRIVSILFVLIVGSFILPKKAEASMCSYPSSPPMLICTEISMDFNNNSGYYLNLYYHVLTGTCSGGSTSNPADGVNCIDLSGQQAIYSFAPGTSSRKFWFDNGDGNFYVWWWANYTASGTFCVDPLDQASLIPVPGVAIVSSTSNVSCTYPPPATPTPTPTPNPGSPCPGGGSACGNDSYGNLGSCGGTWNYIGNSSYDTWCGNNYGGSKSYCYQCTGSSSACPNTAPNPPGGTNTCRNSCLSGENIYGSASSNDCQKAGLGNLCCNAPASGGCTSGQTNPHSACSGTSCISVAGCAASTCTSNAQCGGGSTCPQTCQSSGYLGSACSGGTWQSLGGYTCASGTCQYCRASAPTPTPIGTASCSWSPGGTISVGSQSTVTINNIPAGGNSQFASSAGTTYISGAGTNKYTYRFNTAGTTWTYQIRNSSFSLVASCTISTAAIAATPTPIPVVTVQGRFVDANGNSLTLDIGQRVTVNSLSPAFQNTGTFWSNNLSAGTYAVAAPAISGYTLTSSSCINCTTHTSYTNNASVSVTLLSNGSYADIYFRYAPAVCSTTFSGSLIYDPANPANCATPNGNSYSGFAQVSAFTGSVPPRQQVAISNGSGSYSGLTYAPICGVSSTITLSAVPYTVTGICDDGVYTAQTGYTYPYTSDNRATRNISFLLSSQGPWFQVDTGDVRFPSLTNKIPRGKNASANGNSLFTSSTGNITLGAGTPPTWQVNQEYSYNSDFQNGLGSMSYTFYLSRAKQRAVVILPIASSSIDLSGLGTGVYQASGDLTVTASAPINGGKHIVLLVPGTATVSSNISVPGGANNLFVLAAKGGIVFAQAVGTDPASGTPTNPSVDGYYTSEGSITLNGTNSCPSTDLRLNVGGALVANSLHPFAQSGFGKIIVNRNICAYNLSQPTYYVSPRPDFLLQMTDFYKIPYKTFKEVNP